MILNSQVAFTSGQVIQFEECTWRKYHLRHNISWTFFPQNRPVSGGTTLLFYVQSLHRQTCLGSGVTAHAGISAVPGPGLGPARRSIAWAREQREQGKGVGKAPAKVLPGGLLGEWPQHDAQIQKSAVLGKRNTDPRAALQGFPHQMKHCSIVISKLSHFLVWSSPYCL